MDLTTLCVLILVAFVKNHTKGLKPRMAAIGALKIKPRSPTRRRPQGPSFENLVKVRYEGQTSLPCVSLPVGLANP